MKMTARDLARFGWLYLNRGNWNGLQVIPEESVYESLAAHSFVGTNSYGYMCWTTGHQGEALNPQPSVYRKHLPPLRYFAHGHYGQMIAVMPEKDVVISHLAQSIERLPEQMRNFGNLIQLSWKLFRVAIGAEFLILQRCKSRVNIPNKCRDFATTAYLPSRTISMMMLVSL